MVTNEVFKPLQLGFPRDTFRKAPIVYGRHSEIHEFGYIDRVMESSAIDYIAVACDKDGMGHHFIITEQGVIDLGLNFIFVNSLLEAKKKIDTIFDSLKIELGYYDAYKLLMSKSKAEEIAAIKADFVSRLTLSSASWVEPEDLIEECIRYFYQKPPQL